MEQHKHCRICEKPIPLEEDFCSDKCREEFEDLKSAKKKRQYILYILLIVFVAAIFFTLFW